MTDEVLEALRGWLGPSTWHTNDVRDMKRFYLFVLACWKNKPGIWDERGITEAITIEAANIHKDWTEEAAANIAEERRSHGTDILEFLTLMKEEGYSLERA